MKDIREAALDLASQFEKFHWFVSAGIAKSAEGQDLIMIYTDIKKLIPKKWRGYPIIIRNTGKPIPATKKTD